MQQCHAITRARRIAQYLPVVVDHLYRHAKLARDEIWIPVVQALGACVFGRIDEPQRGFFARAPFRFRADRPAPWITMPGMHELMAERADLLMVKQALVDDDEPQRVAGEAEWVEI